MSIARSRRTTTTNSTGPTPGAIGTDERHAESRAVDTTADGDTEIHERTRVVERGPREESGPKPPRPHSAWRDIPRSRGAVSGLALVLLGAWGALIPFIGPTFDFGYTPNNSWDWTAWRGWLEVLPGGVAALGGLILMLSASRAAATLGGWLATAAGAWFVVGLAIAPVVDINDVGVPLSGGKNTRAWETIGMFTGLGALILFLGAFALGRLSVISARDHRLAAESAR